MALRQGSRLRRGPVLGLLLTLGVVGSAVILAAQLRPSLDLYAAVTVPDAHVGTTYAVDDQVCVRGASAGARIDRVEVSGDSDDLVTRVTLPPPDSPPVVAYPVDPFAGPEVAGAAVPAGDSTCLRLLLSPGRPGEFRAPEITVVARYGPLGLFRRSLSVVPPTTLVVTRSGPDPRSGTRPG